MKKRKVLSRHTQFAMFPESKLGAQEFAKNILEQGLVAKTARRKRPVKGKPMTINVMSEIANAYGVLYKAKGVNVDGFIEILKNAVLLDAEAIVKNQAIISQSGKSQKEMQQIGKAVKIIVYFVNRQRKRNELAKVHAPSKADLAEKSRQQRHLKDIAGK